MLLVADPSGARSPLERAVVLAQSRTALPVVFAGRVVGGDLRISYLRGNRCEALRGLSLAPDIGLGGRAVALGRPVSVCDYLSASAITHEYDAAVNREGLRALLAVPVLTQGTVAAVLYGGVRAAAHLGDRVVTELVTVACGLARELESRSCRRRRIAEIQAAAATAIPAPERTALVGMVEQFKAELTTSPDPVVCNEAKQTCEQLLAILHGYPQAASPPALSPREQEVLVLAAAGCSDAEIAEHLNTGVGAVQGAVRNLRRAFGVGSRHAAVSAARRAGLLR